MTNHSNALTGAHRLETGGERHACLFEIIRQENLSFEDGIKRQRRKRIRQQRRHNRHKKNQTEAQNKYKKMAPVKMSVKLAS